MALSLWVSNIIDMPNKYFGSSTQTDLYFVSSITTAHCVCVCVCVCLCVCVCVCVFVLCMHVSPGQPPVAVSEIKLTSGCSDCIVSYSKYTVGSHTFRGLQLMSKSTDTQTDEIKEEEIFCIHSYSRTFIQCLCSDLEMDLY